MNRLNAIQCNLSTKATIGKTKLAVVKRWLLGGFSGKNKKNINLSPAVYA